MSEPRPGPLDKLHSELQAQADATERLRAAVSALKGVVEQTSPVLSTNVTIAGGVAAELRSLADSIHKEAPTKPGRHLGLGSSAMERAMHQTFMELELPTTFERIRDFFFARGNEPATVPEIVEASRSSPAAVRQLVYKRRKDQFVRVAGPGELTVRYKLTEDALGASDLDGSKGGTVKPP